MKKFVLLLTAALIIVSVSAAFATEETQDVTVSVTLDTAYEISKTNDLSFGTIIADPAGDTITISAAGIGADTASGAAATRQAAGNSDVSSTDFNPATIKVIANIDGITCTKSFKDSSTSSTTTITLKNGVDEIEVAIPTATDSNIGAFDTALATKGTSYLHLGGVMTIPPAAPLGTYTGTMVVTLTF